MFSEKELLEYWNKDSMAREGGPFKCRLASRSQGAPEMSLSDSCFLEGTAALRGDSVRLCILNQALRCSAPWQLSALLHQKGPFCALTWPNTAIRRRVNEHTDATFNVRNVLFKAGGRNLYWPSWGRAPVA